MTLLLGWISPIATFNVSDRVVSQPDRVFDAQSNKALLFLGEDGVFGLSYTGSAYIEGVPTDQWLACALSDTIPNEVRRPAGYRFSSPSKRLYVGPRLDSVVRRLNKVLPPSHNLELMATGWQWSRRHRARPILVTVERSAVTNQFQVVQSRRHLGRRQLLGIAPTQNITSEEVERLRATLRVRGDDLLAHVEGALVATVRDVSTRLPGYVGPDCMSISILPPNINVIRVRYLSSESPRLAAKRAADGSTAFVASTTFTPWIVGTGVSCAPQIASGEVVRTIGGFRVVVDAPPSGVQGLLYASGSVTRPADPTRLGS